MGENKNILLVTLLAIFIVLTILLGGYIVYDKLVLAKNNSTVDNTTDNKIEAITYTLKKEMIGSTVSHYADWDKTRDSESFKIEDENGDLYLTYPVINGNTSDIINLNDTIKKHIEENIDELNNKLGLVESKANGEDRKHEICYWAKLLKSGEAKQYSHFIYLEYEVTENDKNIIITEKKIRHSECATGGEDVENIYTVDKNTGSVTNSK